MAAAFLILVFIYFYGDEVSGILFLILRQPLEFGLGGCSSLWCRFLNSRSCLAILCWQKFSPIPSVRESQSFRKALRISTSACKLRSGLAALSSWNYIE
jgi:hypothetical protein